MVGSRISAAPRAAALARGWRQRDDATLRWERLTEREVCIDRQSHVHLAIHLEATASRPLADDLNPNQDQGIRGISRLERNICGSQMRGWNGVPVWSEIGCLRN